MDYPHIFGGGDCISFQPQPLAKVGVYAVRQNPILFHNLSAALEGQKLVPFDPGGAYLLIFNLGDGKGIFWKKNWVWEGRLGLLSQGLYRPEIHAEPIRCPASNA